MGTKKTLLSGESYKIYHQCFDDKNIYLNLSEIEVEKSEGDGHTLVIPIWLWEKIRRVPALVDLSLAKTTDQEIENKIVSEVNSRIRELSLFGYDDDIMAKFIRISDHLKFGSVSADKEEQIRKGISYYMQERENQRKVIKKIES